MNYQQNLVAERINSDNSKRETIRQLAKRHMMDQSHTTTDEELKNAVVELDLYTLPKIQSESIFKEKFSIEY